MNVNPGKKPMSNRVNKSFSKSMLYYLTHGRVKSRNARSFWSKIYKLAGWLYGLSTSFPISLTHGGQNPGTRLKLLAMSGWQMHKFLKLFGILKV